MRSFAPPWKIWCHPMRGAEYSSQRTAADIAREIAATPRSVVQPHRPAAFFREDQTRIRQKVHRKGPGVNRYARFSRHTAIHASPPFHADDLPPARLMQQRKVKVRARRKRAGAPARRLTIFVKPSHPDDYALPPLVAMILTPFCFCSCPHRSPRQRRLMSPPPFTSPY